MGDGSPFECDKCGTNIGGHALFGNDLCGDCRREALSEEVGSDV